jgi:hypothetical protein
MRWRSILQAGDRYCVPVNDYLTEWLGAIILKTPGDFRQ